MSVDGKNVVQVTDIPGNEYNTAWSADGKRVVYVSPDDQGNHTVWVANADGSNPKKITNMNP